MMDDEIREVPDAEDPGLLINDFDWLNDSILSNDCFVSHDFSRAAKTVDFGLNGYTGSVGDWHSLQQLTAPDPKCGVVYVRGNFPDTADSMLDRAQTETGRGSFGLKICEDSGIGLGIFRSQGLLNYRWPLFSYSITKPSTNAVGPKQDEVGTLHICSFVKDGSVFQVVVIRRERTEWDVLSKLKFQFGSAVRFGCTCKAGSYTGRSEPNDGRHSEEVTPTPATVDNRTSSSQQQTSKSRHDSQYYLESREDGKVISARCGSRLYDHVRLDMQLFVNDKAVIMNRDSTVSSENYVDLSTIQESECGSGDRLVVIGMFSLSAIRSGGHGYLKEQPSSADIADHLGLFSTSKAFTGKLWLSDQIPRDSADSGIESHTIARCVERIMGVSLVPNIGPESIYLPPEFSLDDDTSSRHSVSAESNTAWSTEAPNEIFEVKSSSLADLEAAAGSATQAATKEYLKNRLVLQGRLSNGLGAMLIQNIMTQQYFERENMFWQIRLLVKAFNYHALVSKGAPDDNAIGGSSKNNLNQCMQHTRECYLHKIGACIREALKWMITSALADEDHNPGTSDVHTGRYIWAGEASYPVIAVWYVWKYCENALDEDILSIVSWYLKNQWVPHDIESKHRDKVQHDTTQSEVAHALTQWCYMHSMYNICKSFASTITNSLLESIVRKEYEWRDESERAMKSLRKLPSDVIPLGDPTQLYSRSDEELDRFVMLLTELPFESARSRGLVAQLLQLTRKKLNERTRTTTVNSGYLEHPAKRSWGEADVSAPWEFECLNHHIRLSSFSYPADELEIEPVKKHCFRFLLSDYTFLASLNRSDVDMIAKWWDVKVSSVVCATFLDLRVQERNRKQATDRKLVHIRSGSYIADDATPRLLVTTTTATDNIEVPSRDQMTEKDVVKMLQQFLKKQDVGPKTPFQWTDYDLPGYADPYFPDFVRQSLDDTPKLFTRERLEKVRLRGIEKYLKEKGTELVYKSGAEEWLQGLDAEQFMFISIYDLSLDRNDPYSRHLISTTKISRSIHHFSSHEINPIGQKIRDEINRLMALDDVEAEYCLWSLYLNGNVEDWQGYKNIAHSPWPGDFTQSYQQKLLDHTQLTIMRKWYKERLLYRLSDSVYNSAISEKYLSNVLQYVDLDIRHRIFFVQRVSPNVLKAFIYIWQPDGLDAFSDYIRGRYGFADREGSEYSPWTTMITISHWQLRPKEFPDTLSTLFDEGRLSGLIPPEMLSEAVGTAATSDGPYHLEERCSSIVITGDRTGNFWTCSVISSLIKEEYKGNLERHSMENYAARVREITQLFVHQKDVGRRLSFVMLVGILCFDLAREYNKIIEYLESLMQSSKSTIFEGLNFDKSSKALLRLRLLIWGLESFRALGNVLSSSVTNIRDVKANLDSQTREDRDQWDPRLLHEYFKVVEEFDKRFEELSGALEKINLRVEQTTRLRDGISSFTSVEQSFESLEQNKNIRILTFITIAYLPLGFIAALFSVQYNILPDSAGLGLFLGLVFGMLAFTIILATYMGQVSDLFYSGWNGWMDSLAQLLKQTEKIVIDMARTFKLLYRHVCGRMKSLKDQLLSKPEKGSSKKQDVKADTELGRVRTATSSSVRAEGSLTRVARVWIPGKETSTADIEHGVAEVIGIRRLPSRASSRESKQRENK